LRLQGREGAMGRLRFTTAGESHGCCLVAIVEGLPAGVPVSSAAIDHDLARRQAGYGRGGRMKIETDKAKILSGVRHGRTLGSPVTLLVENKDWENWREVMAAEGDPSAGADKRITRPRPGHADLAAALKYGYDDLRDGLERASARETAARVAAGALAKSFLEELGIKVISHVVAIGGVEAPRVDGSAAEIAKCAEGSPVRCADPTASAAMCKRIDEAGAAGDTVGGLFEVLADGVPPGLGSHVSWDRRLDGRLAAALASIQAIKGVEFGDGFALAARPGSEAHDEITLGKKSIERPTNRAGGLEAGITNGCILVVRAAMKPIATLKKALHSVDLESKKAAEAAFERSDVCAVPAAAVVGEAMVALVLADAALEKFGGDSLAETLRNEQSYLDGLGWRRPCQR